MSIDLHIHSRYSDGSYSPNQILEMAKGLTAISITDHDTIDAYRDEVLLQKHDIKIIPGIEITTNSPYEVHILGYFLDVSSLELVEKVDRNNSIRSKAMLMIANSLYHRNLIDLSICQMIKKYRRITTDILFQEVQSKIPKLGYDEFYYDKEFLGGKIIGLSYYQAVEFVKMYGGISSLAHPNRVRITSIDNDQAVEKLIIDYKNIGGDAIECYHESYSEKDINMFIGYANKYNLMITGGSDFHGEMKPDIQIGVGKGNLNISDKIVEKIIEMRR